MVSSESLEAQPEGFLGKLRSSVVRCLPILCLCFQSPGSQITAEKQRSWTLGREKEVSWNSIPRIESASATIRTDTLQGTFIQCWLCWDQPSGFLLPSLCRNYFPEMEPLFSFVPAQNRPKITNISSTINILWGPIRCHPNCARHWCKIVFQKPKVI